MRQKQPYIPMQHDSVTCKNFWERGVDENRKAINFRKKICRLMQPAEKFLLLPIFLRQLWPTCNSGAQVHESQERMFFQVNLVVH